MSETVIDAINRIELHILDVSMGRVRIGLSPEKTDQYIQEQYQQLRELKHVSA